ncbi:hypothetical protein [Ilumatobacter nonamiensis]|uniref:hypothetical protein n=1 Tax=Ilumatobacter nonamiensis TaxID=467093 RepID=UPI00034C9CDE|nr:hypothetical protein [Ilumatobacter nonamiensis]
MTRRPLHLPRTLTAALCTTALIAGCSSGSDDVADDTVADTTETVAETAGTVAETEETTVETTPETTEAPTTAAEPETTAAETAEPVDATPTEPGSELVIGDAAIVPMDDELPDELVSLTVDGIREGTSEELAQLRIEDAAADAQLFYVDYTIANVSAPEEGADYTPSVTSQFVALDATDTPLTPIIKLVAFDTCENDDVDALAVGESLEQCEIYLAEGGVVAESVGFASGFDSLPIFWR